MTFIVKHRSQVFGFLTEANTFSLYGGKFEKNSSSPCEKDDSNLLSLCADYDFYTNYVCSPEPFA